MSEETQKTSADKKAVDDLTDVLRLQAEALARISERVAGMQAPQGGGGTLVALPPRHEPGGAHNLPVLAGSPALSEESLPVLNAFRQYLDTERRRARIRLVWAAFTFAVLLVAVLSAVLYLGRARADQLTAEIQAARKQAEGVRTSADAGLREAADSLKRDIAFGLQAARSNAASEIGTRDVEIDKLKDTISSLEVENAMLMGKLRDVAQRTEQLQGIYQAQEAGASDAPAPAETAGGDAAATGGSVPVNTRATPQVQFRLPAMP